MVILWWVLWEFYGDFMVGLMGILPTQSGDLMVISMAIFQQQELGCNGKMMVEKT